MKKVISILVVAFILIAGFLNSSCTKDNDLNDNLTQDLIESSIESGSWIITQFEESGKDETHHFSGYSFSFGSDGKLTAENGTNNYEGTWSITDSESSDDSQDDLDFNIHFNLSNDFEDLNDDWDFVSHSDIKIELIDVSGGNGGIDYLTFERN